MPWYGVLMLVVSIVVVMLLAGLAYWKRTQRQMRDQVRGILAEYMPMEDLGEALNPMQTEPDAEPVFARVITSRPLASLPFPIARGLSHGVLRAESRRRLAGPFMKIRFFDAVRATQNGL